MTQSIPWINDKGVKRWSIKDYISHREDGPAIEWPDGSIFWVLHGKHYSFKDFIDHTPISEEEKTALMLKYA